MRGGSSTLASRRRVASMPSMTGMRTSISTTSGRRRRTSPVTPAPSSASPITLRSGSALMIARSPLRISGSSSTSKTPRVWRRMQRQAHGDAPAPRVGAGGHLAAKARDALLYAVQTASTARAPRTGRADESRASGTSHALSGPSCRADPAARLRKQTAPGRRKRPRVARRAQGADHAARDKVSDEPRRRAPARRPGDPRVERHGVAEPDAKQPAYRNDLEVAHGRQHPRGDGQRAEAHNARHRPSRGLSEAAPAPARRTRRASSTAQPAPRRSPDTRSAATSLCARERPAAHALAACRDRDTRPQARNPSQE